MDVDVLPRARSRLRAVALPSEHGGWGLTLEPVLLGLLVAPSIAGGAIGLAAFVAFVARTPLKVLLVDRRRGRWIDRTRVAATVLAVETVILVGLATVAFVRAGSVWVLPALLAVPFVAVELWFDMRSRSRRLVPELCGAIGIGAAGAAIVLAGGDSGRLATAVWLLVAARAIASIPFVRVQIARLRQNTYTRATSDAAQLAGCAVAAVAALVYRDLVLGASAVGVLAAIQVVGVRRPPVPAKVLGLRQLFGGLAVVGAAAVGVGI